MAQFHSNIPAHTLVSKERRKHWKKHGKNVTHDRVHNKGRKLEKAAKALLLPRLDSRVYNCPHGWSVNWWIRMCKKTKKERLITAASLLCAEYDRLYLFKHFKI
jgi:hypothetical protein